jgi:hypothetical protein
VAHMMGDIGLDRKERRVESRPPDRNTVFAVGNSLYSLVV